MSVKSHDGRSLKRSTKMLHQRSTLAIQLESPSYESQSPWTPDQYALVAAAAMSPITPLSPDQPQAQHMQASNVPLYNLKNYQQPWKCEDKDCHKECEPERKILRLEGVKAVLVYLKLVTAKSAPAESKYGILFPKAPRKTIRRVTEKIKTENSSPLLPSPPMPDDIPKQTSSSLSIPASPKRPGTDRIFTDTSKWIRKVAAMDNLRDTAASAEELPPYYHMPSFDDDPAATEQTHFSDAPFFNSPLAEVASLPDISVPSSCTAVVHPNVKGCDSCLSGWRLNGRVNACEICNAHGCVCDASSRASSQKSQSHHSPSRHSSSRSNDGRPPKRQKTSGSCSLTPIKTQSLSSLSYETWNGPSPVHKSMLSFSAPSTEAQNDGNLRPWDTSNETLVHNGSPVHPGLPTLRNKTPSETLSSEEHISPQLHSPSWSSSSPVQSELLKEYEEYPLEEGIDEGLLVVSQFNDEWDTINYPSS